MATQLVIQKEMEQDSMDQTFMSVDDWSPANIEAMFSVADEGQMVEERIRRRRSQEPEGPNYFLVGGPHPYAQQWD